MFLGGRPSVLSLAYRYRIRTDYMDNEIMSNALQTASKGRIYLRVAIVRFPAIHEEDPHLFKEKGRG